jgi:hypothetical protein
MTTQAIPSMTFGARPTGFAKLVSDIVSHLPLTLFVRALRG